MLMKKKRGAVQQSVPKGIAMGGVTGMAFTLSACALCAILVEKEMVREELVGYLAGAILLLGSVVAALITGVTIGQRYLVVCLGAGGVYCGFLLALTAMFFAGQYQGVAVSMLLILGSAVATGLLLIYRTELAAGKKRRKHNW
jgi:hypothetical protein